MTKRKFLQLAAAVFGCAWSAPFALMAQDHHDDDHHNERRYYDRRHKDYHNWDAAEDRAYHMYWEQRHRPYVAFETLTPARQEDYWAWRHEHSNAILNINIR